MLLDIFYGLGRVMFIPFRLYFGTTPSKQISMSREETE